MAGDTVTPLPQEDEITALVGDDFTTHNMSFDQGLSLCVYSIVAICTVCVK